MRSTMGRKRGAWRFGALAASLVLAAGAAPSRAQEIRIREGTYAVAGGFSVTLPIELETTEPVTGFSFGVRHDATKLRLDSVTLGDDLATALGLAGNDDPSGDFFLLDLAPEDGDGFIVAAILAPGEEAVALAAGTHHIFNARYAALEDATGEASVEVTGDLGNPDVGLVIDVNAGTAVPFEGSSATVRFASGFVRADVDQNGNIALTDAIRVLGFLFRGQEIGACPPTLNVDGSIDRGDPTTEDQADIQITDAIQLLRYVFQSGIEPAAPFPTCGSPISPLGPDMLCEGFNCP